MNRKLFSFLLAFAAFLMFFSAAHAAVTVTILNPDGNNYYNPDINNVRISFTIVDTFFDVNDDVNFSIYLSKLANDHNKTIITDANANTFCGAGADYNNSGNGATCQYDWNVTPAGTADGNWLIDINAYTRKVAGAADINIGVDVSNYSFVIDRSVPNASITSPANGDIVYGSSFTLVYTSSDVNSGIKRNYVNSGTGLFTNNGTATSYAFTGLAPNDYNISLISSDFADNNSTMQSITVHVHSGLSDSGSQGGPYCGDRVCQGNETTASCPTDCPAVCGDRVCNGTESTENCAVDCVTPNVCGNTICEAGESCSNCALDCGACTEPEVVLTQTLTEKPTEAEVQGVFTRAGVSGSVEKALDARRVMSVSRHIEVKKRGTHAFTSTISFSIVNTTSSGLSGIKLVEEIPKSVAGTAAQISSMNDFRVLVNDPIVEFTVPQLSSGESATVAYTVDHEITANDTFAPPVIADFSELQGQNACANVTCNDNNPCTQDSCSQGNCLYAPVANGTSCGYENICTNGVCGARSGSSGSGLPSSQGGLVPTILAIIVVIGIVYYFMSNQKKKRW